MPLSNTLAGNLLALSATIIWSSLYIFARTLSNNFTPLELSFWRWFIAFIAFLPFTIHGLIQHRKLIYKHFLSFFIISLIGIPGFSIMIFLAGKTTSVTNMSLLAATAPIFIAIICRYGFKEKLNRLQIIGLTIAVCGVIVLITKGDIAHLFNLTLAIGDVWMLIGAICFATYSVLIRFKPAALPPNIFLSTLIGIGTLIMLPFMIIQWLYYVPFVMPSLADWAAFIYIGIGTSVIGFLFWSAAIARIGAVRTGVIYYSLPFFSFLMAVFFLNEQMSLAQGLGGLLIIAGIITSSLQALMAHKKYSLNNHKKT